MPRESGASSTPRPFDSIIDASGILDHPLSRVMTVVGHDSNFKQAPCPKTCIRDLAARNARGLACWFRPPQTEGAGKTGCALHPRSRVQSAQKKRTRAYRFSGGNPAFPAQWFTAYTALSPVTGLSCHRRRRNRFRRLDASVGASGPHGFAVRIRCSRQSHRRVHRIPPQRP